MDNLEIKCSVCGRVTLHYLTAKGEYKCPVCHTTNKTLPKKAVFEVDSKFEDYINNENSKIISTEEGFDYE